VHRARAAGLGALAATFGTGLACVAGLAWAQLSFPGLLGGDAYFHTRAAQQLHEHGVRTELPQAVYSTWREGYSDKDLLFHALLVPFCRDEGELVAGGKRAVVAFDLLVFGALAWAVASLGLRFGPLWILLFFSSHFLVVHHLLVLRPHLLAMALLPVEMALVMRGRRVALGGASAAHVLAHSSFVLVPGLPLAHGLACRLRGRPVPVGPLAASLAGIGLASLLHPQLPHNLEVAFDQVVGVARSAWAERPPIPHDLFGRELLGMAPGELLGAAPAWLPALAGLGAALAGRPGRRLSVRSLALGLVAAGFLGLTLLSLRFLPFFALVSALLAGSLWTEVAEGWSWRELGGRGSGPAWAAVVLLAGCLAVGQAGASVLGAPAKVRRVRSPEVYRPAIEFLAREAAPEEQVYHSFWWAFSWLYHFRPEGRYVVGLDPVFLYRHDPELFRRMLEAHRGRGDVYQIVAEDFGARWVFVAVVERTRLLRARLAGEPRIRRRYADRWAEVHEVLPAGGEES